MRDDVFTTSPIAVYSILFSEPILPTTHLPKLMPIPMPKLKLRSTISFSRPSAIVAFCISMAHFSAADAGFLIVLGAPKTTIRQSPIYLSSVPSFENTMSTIFLKNKFSVCTVCSALSFSDRLVKFLISANMTAT
ncbi:MAG: hypothetical protein ACD_47C00541G0002 [uncultured bacterium]|nr:MAG: hypothetical protein ACD_47C00541G0002 [uncultured bacterium]